MFAISETIFIHFFCGFKKAGTTDSSFLGAINGLLLCMFATAIYHCLRQWATGPLMIMLSSKKKLQSVSSF